MSRRPGDARRPSLPRSTERVFRDRRRQRSGSDSRTVDDRILGKGQHAEGGRRPDAGLGHDGRISGGNDAFARAAIVDGKDVLTSLLEAQRVICLLAGR